MTSATIEVIMNAYFYTPKYRPPSWTLPQGWMLAERGVNHNPTARVDVPYGNHKFGLIMYRRPLSEQELEDHELTIVQGSYLCRNSHTTTET